MLMYNLALLALLITLFMTLIRKWLQINKFRTTISKLPGFKIHNFIVGNFPLLKKRENISYHVAAVEVITGVCNIFRKEGLFHCWASVEPFVFVYSAENIEPILNSSTLLDKGTVYEPFHVWIGTGVLTSTGDKWKTRRKMIVPTFHYQVLNEFIPNFDKNSRLFVKNLKEHKDKDCIDITSLISLCTLDIISESAMGIEIKCQEKKKSDYVKAVERFSEIFIDRIATPWLYNDFIFYLTSVGKELKKHISILHDLSTKVTNQRKQELKRERVSTTHDTDVNESKRREPLLDTLIKHQFQNSNFPDKGIHEEVDTIMFEAHDTTTMGIGWTLLYLGLYPEIQRKVYEELQTIFGEDKERPITGEDITKMKYLQCVIKESLRLYPPVPGIGRLCTEDININGYTIPRGCNIYVLIYALHRDPKVFPNPEVFDPDRFLPENCIKRHPFAYIPFSAGPRNCIGQKYAMREMKVIVSRTILNFEVESVNPLDKIQTNMAIVCRPVDGFKLRIKTRK